MSSSFLPEYKAEVTATAITTKIKGGCYDEKKNGSDER